LGVQQPQCFRTGLGVPPRLRVELVQDGGDVGVNVADGQHQTRGDLGVRQPFGKQPDDVGLPLGGSGGIVSCGLDPAARDAGDPEFSQPGT
jgi:hypothetical protein